MHVYIDVVWKIRVSSRVHFFSSGYCHMIGC
jgi:hypothetical protein